MTIEHHILKKITTRIALVLALFFTSLPILAQNSDNTIIWSEDFNSRFEVPTVGKNATYTHSDGVIMSRQEATGCTSPELQIPNGDEFKATIYLYGAYGKFSLSFKNYREPTLTITADGSNLTYTTDSSGVRVFEVPKQTEAISLSFTNSNKSFVDLDNIVLTGTADCRPQKQSSELGYSKSEVTTTYGEAYELPVLNNPHDLPVYYWNYDNSVATVDTDGNVSIKGVGRTVITAIFHGDDTYSYQETSYVLNVERKKPDGEIFYESFDNNLSYGGNDGDFNPSRNNLAAAFDNASNVKTKNNLAGGYKCIIVSRLSSSGGYYEIENIKGLRGTCTLSFRIAGMANKTPSCSIVVNNKTTSVELDKSGQWYHKEVTLTGLKASHTIAFTGKYFFLDDVSIVAYNLSSADVNVSSAGYATLYYSNKALIVPDGMEAYTMLVADDEVKKSHSYVAGSTIPNGTAVVLKADEGKYTMRVSSEEGFDDSSNNMLMGSDTETTTTGGDLYYKLASPDGVAGFYWGAENGVAFTNGAHKAYLALKTSANSRKALKSYAFHTDDTSTGISANVQDSHDQPCYNLQGQRVGHGYKGIVIRKGGKKIVRR